MQLLGITYFMRMCGPAGGYFIAAKLLNLYIEPSLTPTITTEDQRWLGAWWIGWLVLAVPSLITAVCFGALLYLYLLSAGGLIVQYTLYSVNSEDFA